MMLTKRSLLRVFFGIEVVVFVAIYFFGAEGLRTLVRLKYENSKLAEQVKLLSDEVKELETTVIAWQKDPFYKEKAARETLHMARKNDQVYLIG